MFDLADIARRVQTKKPVTPEEFAYLIRNNRDAFFAFIIGNNPDSMNDILRHRLGYYELGFRADVPMIQRITQMILDREDQPAIKTIVQNFQVNTGAISPQLWNAIKNQFKK